MDCPTDAPHAGTHDGPATPMWSHDRRLSSSLAPAAHSPGRRTFPAGTLSHDQGQSTCGTGADQSAHGTGAGS
eukprot:7096245-Pyramimonas_sp.AAC.1